jgi:Transposase DDE domain group 1
MQATTTTSIHKVRRDALGGKRGDGHRRLGHRRVRPDPRRIHSGQGDPSLTGCGGLVQFGTFLRQQGIDDGLKQRFERLKDGALVVYPMPAQLRLLIDAAAIGEDRVFGLESWAADPLFVRLAGGVIPSLDTVYRDLARFDDQAIRELETWMAALGLVSLPRGRNERLHIDVDSTVEPLFGTQQGALPGPNPRYHGRPSFHPLLAAVAETGTIVAAELRPGDCGFGDEQADFITRAIDRVRAENPSAIVCVRIDAAGDCTRLMQTIAERHAYFFIKAKMDRALCEAVTLRPYWKTVDLDAHGHALTQVAEIPFLRPSWLEAAIPVRVIARRTREHTSGRQTALWQETDWTTQVFLTSDPSIDPADVPFEYNGRASIEPLIAELKGAWALGKVPSETFVANHAMFLLKLLTHNLMRRFVRHSGVAHLQSWRADWVRRVLLCVPGRLLRSGRRWSLRLPMASPLTALRC